MSIYPTMSSPIRITTIEAERERFKVLGVQSRNPFVTHRLYEHPLAIAATDLPAGSRVEIDLGTRTARKLPDVSQLGVPGCRCGCSDGKRAR